MGTLIMCDLELFLIKKNNLKKTTEMTGDDFLPISKHA